LRRIQDLGVNTTNWGKCRILRKTQDLEEERRTLIKMQDLWGKTGPWLKNRILRKMLDLVKMQDLL
jgi:hypothetical protein